MLGEFVDRVYFPHIQQHTRPSTLKGYRDIWRNHVKAHCADVWLKDVRTFHVQGWLDAIAAPGTLGRKSLKHIKTFLSALCSSWRSSRATTQGKIQSAPLQRLRRQQNRKKHPPMT